MQPIVYTIGHSTRSLATLVTLLRQHAITAVADVRSQPYSRITPQFNRKALHQGLAETGISYVFLGRELGGRISDRTCYIEGKVRYDLVARTELFKYGLNRVQEGAKKFRIALMCTEREPLQCHRGILISRYLRERGVLIYHILGEGEIEDHAAAEERLLRSLRLPEPDMFTTKEALIDLAYSLQGERIAYQIKKGLGAPEPDRSSIP